MPAPRRPARDRRRPASAPILTLATAALVAVAACGGASREALAADYQRLADAANAAAPPLLASLSSTVDPRTRSPILVGLADVEKTFADGVASLQASGDVKAAADEVIRLTHEREAAYRAAAEATTAEAQNAALVAITGAGADAFHAAVDRLRTLLALPSVDAGASPTSSPQTAGPPAEAAA